VISALSLSGLGVIDSAELDLGSGLTVLTGETGAGKTMVITSLELLLGGRASSDLIRSGADRAQVTAHFDVNGEDDLVEQIGLSGGVVDDDTVTATRVLSASGRSRAAVGGAAVPISVLADVGAELVAVHGQHDQSRLTSARHQRELLDRFGGATELSTQVAAHYQRLRTVIEERNELVQRQRERLREVDALQFGVREIGAVEPRANEDDELQAEESTLAHAVDLRQAADGVATALNDDEQSVLEQLASLQRMLDAQREHDPRLDDISSRLADVTYAVTDLGSELRAYAESVEADPVRLASVQERRSALTGLMRKYGPTLDDVLSWTKDASRRLTQLADSDERVLQLEAERQEIAAQWIEAALSLREARQAAARTLSEQVTGELKSLAMPDAELVVEVSLRLARTDGDGVGAGDGDSGEAISDLRVTLPDGAAVDVSAAGLDDVSFLLRPHRGAPLTAVHKGASGGELSRIMLAVEVVLADADPVPTVVFDEVDAGVGGSAAVEVGRRLARLGRSRQVVVVTHLPQVAAFADRHWVVRKATDGEVTASDVTELDESDRVAELTRMLAGLADSSSGRAHAEELLEVARTSR
jgi:DNA repair protein RecN (Recombination protein N)